MSFPQTSHPFVVTLSNCGNPDYGQDPDRPLPGTRCGTARCATLKQAQAVCMAYIRNMDLGGGNWTGGEVVRDGVVIGRFSYNGRLWNPDDKEIIID